MKLRRMVSGMMALLLAAGMPLAAFAEEYDLSVGSVTVNASESGQTVSQENGVQNHTETSPTVIKQSDSSTPTTNTITINADAGATANVTLENVNIDTISTGEAAVEIKGNGDVVIELDGTNTVQSSSNHAGVEKNTIVPTDTDPGSCNGNLTITDENETHGSLEATGGYYGAGIGGSDYSGDSSNITITGNAEVTATGGKYGAGIGGGWGGDGSNITIEGNAKVTATGGDSGAGIGGGDDSDGSYIIINGNAEVIATGGDSGAGIGGGRSCGDGSYITIEGNAQVTAKGGDYGAGIGGGECCDGSNITISGSAEVTATGGKLASGIGGGMDGDGSNITISGSAEVTAKGGARGSGIGGGGNHGKGSNITASGDAQVKAQGGEATNNPATGAAIGDGVQYESDISAREETPNTGALNKGWIATYTPGAKMSTDAPNSVAYMDNGQLTTSSNAVPFAKQEPTCTEDGYRAGFTIGDTKIGGQTLNATGHSFTNYIPDGKATCTADDTKTAQCDHAGCDKKDTIPDPGTKKPHSMGAYHTETPATCQKEGVERRDCKDCDYFETGSLKKVDHSYGDFSSDNNATCTSDGTKTRKCIWCNLEDTVTDPGTMKEHSFTNYISDKNATYEADGTKTAKCDHCDATHTIPDPGTKLVRKEVPQTAPLYRVVGQDGKAIACKAEQKGGVLTITVEADFATLTGSFSGLKTLKAQGVDTIVFATNGATSTFALSDLLAQGGDSYQLTHDGKTVTFTLGSADIGKILK